jgi:hypothetical protein
MFLEFDFVLLLSLTVTYLCTLAAEISPSLLQGMRG